MCEKGLLVVLLCSMLIYITANRVRCWYSKTKRTRGESMKASAMRELFKEQFGFYPPCQLGAAQLGSDMEEIITQYHHAIWGEERESILPLKYRYLIALATAVYSEDETRAKLELLKALRHGVTRQEIMEVLRQQVWMRGAPLIVKIIPLIQFMEKVERGQEG